jgi:antitoxin component of MazEF toxin-antitoxin module
MERRLVKQGRNALTITLPADWLRRRGLKAGEPVYVSERGQELVVNASMRRAAKETTIDARGPEPTLVWHLINAKYIAGYDTIILQHNHQKMILDIADRLPGMALAESGASRSVLQTLIAVPEGSFEVVMRRTLHLLVEHARVAELVAAKKADVAMLKEEERRLDSTVLYCLRYLNKYESTQDASQRFLLCATIEAAGDIVSDLAQCSSPKLMREVRELVESYTAMLAKGDLKGLYGLLREARKRHKRATFADGLAYMLAQTLYNYLAYTTGRSA